MFLSTLPIVPVSFLLPTLSFFVPPTLLLMFRLSFVCPFLFLSLPPLLSTRVMCAAASKLLTTFQGVLSKHGDNAVQINSRILKQAIKQLRIYACWPKAT